jgi:hypothetical protein
VLQVVCEQEEGFPPRLKLADLEEGDELVSKNKYKICYNRC